MSKILAKAQRTAAHCVGSACRTVSEAAVLIISGMMLIDILARQTAKWITHASELIAQNNKLKHKFFK